MYDPNDRRGAAEPTELAPAVTQAAPTADIGAAGSAVVDDFAWSQEEPGGADPPVPFAEDPYDGYLSALGRIPVAVPPPGRPRPAGGIPRTVFRLAALVAMIAVAGAAYSLLRSSGGDAPTVPSIPTSTAPAPPPVTQQRTTQAPPTTTTAPPPTATQQPTTTRPPVTTQQPTTTAPPTATAPPTTEAPVTTAATEVQPPTPPTIAMTTEYLRIPLVPIPIPITVPQP